MRLFDNFDGLDDLYVMGGSQWKLSQYVAAFMLPKVTYAVNSIVVTVLGCRPLPNAIPFSFGYEVCWEGRNKKT